MLEGHSGDHLVKPLCSIRATWSRLSRTMSRWLLAISKDEDFIASLGDPLPVFNQFHRAFFKFQCATITSFPVAGHHWKEPGSTHYAPLLQVFIRYLLRLYISRLNSRSSLRLPHWRDASVISWSCWPLAGLSLVCPCISCSRNLTQHSRCGFTSAEERGRITSFNLLALHCLIWLWTWLSFFATRAHRWLMLN